MPESTCGPTIKLSLCGVGAFSATTGALEFVACPSRMCAAMVPLVDGCIADHTPIMPKPERCPWVGVRVVDDRADFDLSGIGVVHR